MFWLVSDGLERFEHGFMRIRNSIATSFLNTFIWMDAKALKLVKFVPTSELGPVQDSVSRMDKKIRKEIQYRNSLKENKDPGPRKTRDSITVEQPVR